MQIDLVVVPPANWIYNLWSQQKTYSILEEITYQLKLLQENPKFNKIII